MNVNFLIILGITRPWLQREKQSVRRTLKAFLIWTCLEKKKKEKVKETYSDELVDYGSHVDLQRIMTRLGKNEGFLPRLGVFSVRQWKIRGISCTKIRNR